MITRPGIAAEGSAKVPKAPEGCQFQVSVVIPCLNEEESIAGCVDEAIEALRQANIQGEVVVTDNGSVDRSAEIAKEHGARVVRAPLRGYGSALRKGLEEARGAFIIMGDADGSHDFSEIPRYVAKWHEGYDLVVGNRFQGEIKRGAMKWHHRYVGTPALSAILNLFFGAGVGDVNCGMRGITQSLFRRIDCRTTGMEFASESLVKAAKLGARITEIPITARPDNRTRPPHLRSFQDGWRHLRFLLMCAPNWLFLAPGGLLVASGFGLVLWLLPGPRFAGKIGFDIHTMAFGLFLILLGFHIFSIGLFAKVFSYTEKLSGNGRTLESWLRHVKLEHGLLLGSAMALAGLLGDSTIFWHWASSGFEHFHAVRATFFWTLCMFLGIEIVFSSFFLSMLGISRAIYIGD